MKTFISSLRPALALIPLWPLLFVAEASASSGALQLTNRPVIASQPSQVQVKPNIAFILDDSGSMAYQNMPQDDDDESDKLCRGWYKYNTLAYNPNETYKAPFDPNKAPNAAYGGETRFPDAVFTNAYKDGYFNADGVTFDGGAGTNTATNLRTTIPFYGDDEDDDRYYYTYVKTNLSQSKRNSTRCLDDDDYVLVKSRANIAAPGVTTGSDEAWKNYANWYSYYRTRAGLMKASVGEAFRQLDGDYRVGLFYINSQRDNALNTDLKIDTFAGDHRKNWYRDLYAYRGNGSTPLRRALSRVGRMFAGQIEGYDPVQYSCQKNFSILSTDGYWNDTGTAAVKIDGTTQVGNVDGGTTPRPFKDANNQANTLADIAYYYYSTDLRDSALGNCANRDDANYSSVCATVVPGQDGLDTKQFMTTYTLGVGADGKILYEADYENAPDIKNVTQYYDIVNGSANWPSITFSSSSDKAKIDDLWHAAVNGRGRFYSATDATSLYRGLQSALLNMQVKTGSASAAATSTLEPVSGDNTVFVALYETGTWNGDLKAFTMDPSTGEVGKTEAWSAQTKLDQQVASSGYTGRNIYFFDSSVTDTKRKLFTYDNLSAGDKLHFANICSKIPLISQCEAAIGTLDSSQRTIANNGTNLVNYLRGQSTYEDKTTNAVVGNRVYRARQHLLGDIVSGAPVYVKKPPFSYDNVDSTYAGFKSDKAGRDAMVYVAANDGMLHAFNAVTNGANAGREEWAYIPKEVMKNMWRLADNNYQHRYFTDGAPTVADICTKSKISDPHLCDSKQDWRTVLIAGLNKGGCSYYALDVTEPGPPKVLWEFSHANLGYSFGNPIVAKNSAGRWVVMFASGYNNIPGSTETGDSCRNSGDGNGHVFVLDAFSGDLVSTISTNVTTSPLAPAGTAASPSGLAKLNAWIDSATNPVVTDLYGGDIKGNLWRINLESGTSTLLAQLKDDAAEPKPQPITIKPELAVINAGSPGNPSSQRLVLVGTGKLLEAGDLFDYDSQHSLYAIKDSSSGGVNVRGTGMVKLTLTQTEGTADGSLAGRVIRKVTGNPVNWAQDDGWYLDFNPNDFSPGERVNIDMSLQSGVLAVATNVPAAQACTTGGYGFLYLFDIEKGSNLEKATEGMAGIRLSGNALIAGLKTLRLPSRSSVIIVTDTAGNITTERLPGTGSSTGLRRTAWRELFD